jgi:formylglycine-generating enzyme required for sulfatase activity
MHRLGSIRFAALTILVWLAGVGCTREGQPSEAGAKTLTLDCGNDVEMELVAIPAGTFTMGSNEGDANEKPSHLVTISQPFYMGKYEVTHAQWRAVMGSNPSCCFDGDYQPVQHVSWSDCQEFCNRLSTKTGRTVRLPTEAEWEYACRAGSTGTYCFGNDASELSRYAYHEGNSDNYPHPVGGLQPNAWGLYDMHGNVWEWCADLYGVYSNSSQADPRGAVSGGSRVIRGGHWAFRRCSSVVRVSKSQDEHQLSIGFRVVAEASAAGVLNPPRPKPAVRAGEPLKTLTLDCGNGVKLELVLIPAGTFTMGSNDGDDNEKPPHLVTIGQPFYIGKFEVTQAQWRVVMGNNPSDFKGDELPVGQVNWDDCQEFCKKLSAKTGKEIRLPTESEWEYACRAGSTGKYSFGDSEKMLGSYAWYDENSDGKPRPVGQKKPNAWGLYDMHGNMWEWCCDWYDKEFYAHSPKSDPQGPSSGVGRVWRGGSWMSTPALGPGTFRSAWRGASRPGFRASGLGFRLAAGP